MISQLAERESIIVLKFAGVCSTHKEITIKSLEVLTKELQQNLQHRI